VDVLACLQIPLQLLPALKIVARLPLLGKAYVEERSQWPNRYAGLNMEVASVGNDYDTITQALSRLQCTGSFVDMVTDVMISKQTSGKERCLVQAAFIAGTEYGSSAASSTAMRLLTMRGAGFVEAFQGVLSTFGFYHLGALPECAMMLWRMQHSDLPLEIQINDELKNSAWGTGKAVKFARRIPGFGHRFFKDDPRARELLTVCNKIISGPYIDLITEVDDVLGRRNIGRLNMDGIGAAMGLHFGFSPCITPALSLISRTLGVAKLFQATEVTVEDCSLSFRSPKMR
jgi:citrate synthase